MSALPRAECAIVGGSGLYELAGMSDATPVAIETPFGEPSVAPLVGRIGGRAVAFLARHGADHRLLPSEINYRANIFALKLLGVERIVSVSAVGSMTPKIRPRDLVLVDQFVDHTRRGAITFFGQGVAAHVSLAEPVCPETRSVLAAAAGGSAATLHGAGTYLCIEGPAFSTRAESLLYRSWGVDVIGMTNVPEARLAREAEICYATLALVTDYDCWHESEAAVSVESLLDNLRAANRSAAEIVARAIAALPARRACRCGDALRDAVITPRARIPPETRARLRPILARFLDQA